MYLQWEYNFKFLDADLLSKIDGLVYIIFCTEFSVAKEHEYEVVWLSLTLLLWK